MTQSTPTEAWLKEAEIEAEKAGLAELEAHHRRIYMYSADYEPRAIAERYFKQGVQWQRERSTVVLESKELPPEATGKHIEAMLSFFTGDSQRSAPDEQESPYCSECGSCGEVRCCGPRRCLYPTVNAEEVEEMGKVAEKALKERDSARAEAASLRAELKVANCVVEQLQRAAKFQKEQFDGIQERRGQLVIERDALRAQHAGLSEQLAEATKALEFYAILENYRRGGDLGKIARETLAKLKAGRKEG